MEVDAVVHHNGIGVGLRRDLRLSLVEGDRVAMNRNGSLSVDLPMGRAEVQRVWSSAGPAFVLTCLDDGGEDGGGCGVKFNKAW